MLGGARILRPTSSLSRRVSGTRTTACGRGRVRCARAGTSCTRRLPRREVGVGARFGVADSNYTKLGLGIRPIFVSSVVCVCRHRRLLPRLPPRRRRAAHTAPPPAVGNSDDDERHNGAGSAGGLARHTPAVAALTFRPRPAHAKPSPHGRPRVRRDIRVTSGACIQSAIPSSHQP